MENSVVYSHNQAGQVLSEITIDSLNLPQKIICLSTTYLPYFEALHCLDKVIACVDLDRIPNTYRNIQNLSSANLDLEKILSLQPDLIIANSFQEKEISFLKNKFPVLIVNEFWENHPLGRAEWILPFGLIAGKKEKADSIFLSVKNQYNEVLQNPPRTKNLILNLSKYSESYFVPGGNSLIARYFKDLNIPFQEKGNGSESVEISEEEALSYLSNAKALLFFDWHLKERNYEEIAKELGIKGGVLPIIYCNTFQSNYFQEGILHPDKILLELKLAQSEKAYLGQFFKRLEP